MTEVLGSTSFSGSVSKFFDAVGKFFADLAAVHWGVLALAMAFFALNLTLRSRAIFNSMRAAYPDARFQWRRIWGAYFAAVGFNNVVPARGGDVIKVFLAKSSIPDSTYATVTASIYTEAPFDAVIGVFVLIFAFTQGVFPKPPDFAKLNAFDLSFLASNFRLTLFLITLLGIAGIIAFAFLSRRVVAFWRAAAPGLRDPARPPPLPAPGRGAAGGGVAVARRRLLVLPRRVRHRRLGAQRHARVRASTRCRA